jgi:hypothetical protein
MGGLFFRIRQSIPFVQSCLSVPLTKRVPNKDKEKNIMTTGKKNSTSHRRLLFIGLVFIGLTVLGIAVVYQSVCRPQFQF